MRQRRLTHLEHLARRGAIAEAEQIIERGRAAYVAPEPTGQWLAKGHRCYPPFPIDALDAIWLCNCGQHWLTVNVVGAEGGEWTKWERITGLAAGERLKLTEART